MYISKRMIIAGVLLALVFGGAAYVFAQGDGVINACINPAGALRILGEGGSCLPKETPLSWNKQGPQGEKGDKGDTGDVGPQGPPGVSGYQIVINTKWTPDTPIGYGYSVIAYCPDGMKVLGGGGLPGSPNTGFGGWYMVVSQPLGDDGWAVGFDHDHITANNVIQLTAYAICANVTE